MLFFFFFSGLPASQPADGVNNKKVAAWEVPHAADPWFAGRTFRPLVWRGFNNLVITTHSLKMCVDFVWSFGGA